MLHKNTSSLIKQNSISVEPSIAGVCWEPVCQQNNYHVWVPADDSLILPPSVYVRSPQSKFDSQNNFIANGYIVSFSEEAVIMLGCQHLELFGAIPECLFSNRWVPIKDIDSYKAIINTLKKMIEVNELENAVFLTRLTALLKIFIVHVSRLYALKEMGTQNAERTIFIEHLTQLLAIKDCVREAVRNLAIDLAVDQDHLNLIIHNKLGYSTNQLIQKCLIKKAKYAAINSQENMKEIALRLGFCDTSHFSKFFRAKSGMTFTNYRNTYQNF